MKGNSLAAALALALAGCTSLPPGASGPDALKGCWAEKTPTETRTMRWFAAGDGAWAGEAVSYSEEAPPQSVGLRLEAADAGWRICRVFDDLAIETTCTPTYFGGPPRRPSVDWAEIYAGAERLVMIGRTRSRSTTIFDGARDGCD